MNAVRCVDDRHRHIQHLNRLHRNHVCPNRRRLRMKNNKKKHTNSVNAIWDKWKRFSSRSLNETIRGVHENSNDSFNMVASIALLSSISVADALLFAQIFRCSRYTRINNSQSCRTNARTHTSRSTRLKCDLSARFSQIRRMPTEFNYIAWAYGMLHLSRNCE